VQAPGQIDQAVSKHVGRSLPPPPPNSASFPPQPPPVAIGGHASKLDFTQCDMGGGCRTPLTKCGPQFHLRTKPAKPLHICSEVRRCVARWWDETIGRFGADDIAPVHYLHGTCQATGAGRRAHWVDGTASQSWNRVTWRHCLDCVNPDSPTFSAGDNALCGRVDMRRNPVGHTFVKPDATHGVVCRRGASLQQVASTKEWSEEVCAKAREGEQAINPTFVDKSCFRKWKKHLSQMCHANPATTMGKSTGHFRITGLISGGGDYLTACGSSTPTPARETAWRSGTKRPPLWLCLQKM
jgi:hypothetical protein